MPIPNSNKLKTKPGDKLTTNIVWALEFVWRSGPGLTAANAALTLLQTLLPLVGFYLMKLVVDAVSARVAGTATIATTHITYLILLSGGVFLLDRVLVTVVEFVRTAQTHIATDRIYGVLHAKAIEVDLEYYENSNYYDALHRALQDAPYRPKRILDNFFSFVQSAISLVAICGLLLTFHWIVPLFLLSAALPGLLMRFRFAKKLFIWSRTKTPAERQALYFTSLLTGESHPKEIRLFNLGKLFIDRFERLRNYIRHETLNILKKRSVADLFTQTAAIIPVFALYAFLAARALEGLITVGDLVMFYQAIQRGQTSLGQFLGSIAEMYENNLFLANVHDFLALKPRITDPPNPKTIPAVLREGIVFENLRFQYPDSDRPVLDGIDIRIHPGEHVALVGENGCGKTTLVKLLARLYDPTEGAIKLDGIDLRDMSVSALRQRISIIFQDYAKYPLSARENIWFGDIEVPHDDQRITWAARQAGAHNTIAKLKDGYDTILGKQFENGQELSIGEWQRVALARAFWRDAHIMILDEPTSAMDAKAEYEIFDKLHHLFHGRTAILISHRLSTVRMADRIYFLEGGKIVENGSHDALIDQGGKYAYMFEKQAQYYR